MNLDYFGQQCYVIYLKKPKKALIITENKNILSNKDLFQEKGFYVEHKDKLSNIKDFTHQFLVLDTDEDDEIKRFLEENKLRLPFRILTKTDFSGNIECVLSNVDKCYLFLWKKWFEKYFSNDDRKDKKIQLIENKINEWENNINNCCLDQKIEVIRCKKEQEDHDPQNHIVLTHNIKICGNKEVYINAYYIEGIKSGSGDGGLYQMIDELKSSPFLVYKLLETFLFKIVIVDERIYKKINVFIQPEPSDKWACNKIKLDELWKKRQVMIIDHNEIIEKNNWNFISEFKPDILIIHQGVIDKCNGGLKDENFSNKWNDIRKKIRYIIIDSDRGKPADIKELGARWLQFSDLSNIIIDKAGMNIAKYLLVSLITSIRED